MNATFRQRKGDPIIVTLGSEISIPNLSNIYNECTNKTYADYLERQLKYITKIKYINSSFYKFNLPTDIDSILSNDLSISQIKSLINAEMRYYADFDNSIYINSSTSKSNNNSMNISTELKSSKEPIVIYSSTPREFSAMTEMSTGLTNDQKKQILLHLNLSKFINGIDKNIEHIYKLNPNSYIFVLGIYIDEFVSKMKGNVVDKGLLSILNDIANCYNSELKRLCRKYNMIFINNKKIHKQYLPFNQLTKKGHKLVSEIIIDSLINTFPNYIEIKEEFPLDQLGLKGMYNDLCNIDVTNDKDKKEVNIKQNILSLALSKRKK